ncbi:hypothetical protein F3I62_03590 [Pseudomonas sp. R-28-1W-6]|uniref:hypothetical protein n=1 Tax=Pseudomonas sp. R-28-1W-6 TaxID=2650101 RepID=UPI0013667E2F|nr:hypothetical protein [Pseudomonas sp. R-28-1W-6]MWV11171.1 hypothetical protein [Pseudomonas sp. R-28-1W-6]
MTDDEIRMAVKVLRLAIDLDNGDTLTPEQLAAWSLIRDTYVHDWLSHPGSAAEQVTGVADRPVVVVKRTVARWRQ